MSDSSDALPDTSPKQQALNWLVRLRDDQLTDADLEDFAIWLASDPAHADAYNLAEALFHDMVLAGREQPRPSSAAPISNTRPLMRSVVPKPRKHRWRRLQGAAATAAAWLLATQLILPRQAHWLDALLSDYRTQTGELRDIRLSDGSRLMLNTDSAISVRFDAGLRRIVLHHGQASFSVAPDSTRPFEVAAADVTVRALGTIFDVYKTDAGLTRIEVKEHAVAVSAGRETKLEVAAGQAVELREGRPLAAPAPVRLDQSGAWQQRRLIINDKPLAELVAELERYRYGRIFLSDTELARQRVSGVFALDDPDSALKTLTLALNLKSSRLGPFWTVLHR